MLLQDFYKKKIGCSTSTEVFEFLLKTLKPTITGWDYFVNWNKVLGNVKNAEILLNTLNYLIGKEDIEQEFLNLFNQQPEIISVIPALLACRDKCFDILIECNSTSFGYKTFNFTTPHTISPEDALAFAKSSGLFDLMRDRKIKNLVDYLIGVEVGLDSNGRKNRSGKAMENIVEIFVKKTCDEHKLAYLKEANRSKIKNSWDIDLYFSRLSFPVFKRLECESFQPAMFAIPENISSAFGKNFRRPA